jgi:hypothetical protein
MNPSGFRVILRNPDQHNQYGPYPFGKHRVAM